MAVAASMDDLTVLTPAGDRCRFELELAPVQGDGPPTLIKRLVRHASDAQCLEP
jgi:hypothetical protein